MKNTFWELTHLKREHMENINSENGKTENGQFLKETT